MEFLFSDTRGGLDASQLYGELVAAGLGVEIVCASEPGVQPRTFVVKRRRQWTDNMQAKIREVVAAHKPHTKAQRKAARMAKLREAMGLE